MMNSIAVNPDPIYYVLLSDRTGDVVSGQLNQVLTKVKLRSDKFQAYQGDLLKLLGFNDDKTIDLVSVDNETHYLHKCPGNLVQKLTDQEFDILHAVQSHNNRYDVLPRLEEACKLKKSNEVFVFENKAGTKLKNGTLTHVGPFPDKMEKGTFFGVKFFEQFNPSFSSAEIVAIDRYNCFVTVNHLDLQNSSFPSKVNRGVLYEKDNSLQKQRQSVKNKSREAYQSRTGTKQLYPEIPQDHPSDSYSIEIPQKDKFGSNTKTYATMDKKLSIRNVTKKDIEMTDDLYENQKNILQNISERKGAFSSETPNIDMKSEETSQRQMKMKSCDQKIEAIKREFNLDNKITSEATYASKLYKSKVPTQNLDDMSERKPVVSTTSLASVYVDDIKVTKCTSEQLNLQLESMVEILIESKKHYGVLKWKGENEKFPGVTFAGVELDDNVSGCSDGTFLQEKRFNSPLVRAFFVKLHQVHPDSRFAVQNAVEVKGKKQTSVIADKSRPIKGSILPSAKLLPNFTGKNRGIQGHYNSCYMDSSLFAMFAYSHSFDIMLNRKRRESDIKEYDDVQTILKEHIVNPLRKYGFVGHPSVLQLRKFLNDLCDIGGFMTEEKDPEEFIVLLFEKVLKVDPFVKLSVGDREEVSHLYQIFCAKDENNLLPSIQYLLEYSFLSSNLKLAEIPSVMILQMPRFGQEKLFRRIQITSTIDVAPILTNELQSCALCGTPTHQHCPDCAYLFGYNKVHTFMCDSCWDVLHKHPNRKSHKKPSFVNNKVSKTSSSTQLELFAVVCIEKSHYVSFVRSGFGEEEKWLFFDSMADRVGGENGHNIPEITVVDNLKMFLNGTAEQINELDKKIHEQVIRVFDDASLCFYYNKDLSLYR